MTEENKTRLPVVDKQMMVAGMPFRLVSREYDTFIKTNYAYYQKQKREGGSLSPILFRYKFGEDGKPSKQAQKYDKVLGEWKDVNLWNDFTEEAVDKEGNVKLKANGKPELVKLWEVKKVITMEFDKPQTVEYYDSQAKATVVAEHTTIQVRVSPSMVAKIEECFEDPRNKEDDFYVIVHDPDTEVLADRYKVRYHHS